MQNFYPESGSPKGNLKGLPKAALDSKFTTAKKTVSQYRYNKVPYDLGFTDTKPTISNSYKQVISKQYPKYTGAKAPYTGGGQGPTKMFEGTARQFFHTGELVDGGRRRAVGPYSNIPKDYLKNQMNKNEFLSRSAKFSKGMTTAGKILKGVNVASVALAAAEGIYKGTKRALGPGGTEFHTGTGVPVWDDRNPSNNNTKLNY